MRLDIEFAIINMEITKNDLNVFGFTDAEAQILFVLDEVGPETVSDLRGMGDVARITFS